jgi:dolichyl-phosphate-mannose--protein O-mannosyl transferase
VDIPIEVQEPGSINWSILGAIAFFLVIAVWLALRWKRRKGKSPKLRRGDRGKR